MSYVDVLEHEIAMLQEEVVYYSNTFTTVQEQLSLLVNHTVPPPPEPTIAALYDNDLNDPTIVEDKYCAECGDNLCKHEIPMQYDTHCMTPMEFLYQHTLLDIHAKLLGVEFCTWCYTLGHLCADCPLQYDVRSMTTEELRAEQEVIHKEQMTCTETQEP